MFGFIKKKKDLFDLLIAESENFQSSLSILCQILKRAKLDAQAKCVEKLLELVKKKDFVMYVKLLNSVDMWGGAGSVWEVYIEDKNETRKFEEEMIRLISLMEKTGIIGKGILPIKKIFEKNLNQGQ